MKPRLLDYLVCPQDQSELKLVAWNIRPIPLSTRQLQLAASMRIEKEKINKEVFDGVLVNHKLKIIYPIIDRIPRLLSFSTSAMRAFVFKHAARLEREFPGYCLPEFQVRNAEREEANAFQTQLGMGADLSTVDRAIFNALVRSLELILDTQKESLKKRVVLDVGFGLGGVAGHFAEKHMCELIGIDASHIVDEVQKFSEENPFFHPVQASILFPPFKTSSFDLVYSYGGLNRFADPESAVGIMSNLLKKKGRISIWFENNNPKTSSLWHSLILRSEKWIRPVLSVFPRALRTYALMTCTPLYMLQQRLHPDMEISLGVLSGAKGAFTVAQQRSEMQQNLSDQDVRDWVETNGLRLDSLRSTPYKSIFSLSLWSVAGVEGVRE